MLTIQNVNSDPFVPTCNTCDMPTETFAAIDNDKLHCSNCEELTSYKYFPRLHYTIQITTNFQKQCTLQGNLLITLCPPLMDVTYENYFDNTSNVIYSLRDFHIHGTFTLDHANVILDKV